MAWRWMRPPTQAAAAFENKDRDGSGSGSGRRGGGASPSPAPGESLKPPALVAKLLGHTAACVALSTGNPDHLVSGAHDGTVRVWDMPRLSRQRRRGAVDCWGWDAVVDDDDDDDGDDDDNKDNGGGDMAGLIDDLVDFVDEIGVQSPRRRGNGGGGAAAARMRARMERHDG